MSENIISSIQLSKKTMGIISKYGKKGDTYEEILLRIIENYEINEKSLKSMKNRLKTTKNNMGL